MTNAQWFAMAGGMLLTMGLTSPAAATSAAQNGVRRNSPHVRIYRTGGWTGPAGNGTHETLEGYVLPG